MIQKRNEDFVMNGDFQVTVKNAVVRILTVVCHLTQPTDQREHFSKTHTASGADVTNTHR